MAEVSSAEVRRNFGVYREMAKGAHGAPEPMMVLHYNKPSVAIVAASGYPRLKRRDKRVMVTEDLPEWPVGRIASAEMDPRLTYFDETD